MKGTEQEKAVKMFWENDSSQPPRVTSPYEMLFEAVAVCYEDGKVYEVGLQDEIGVFSNDSTLTGTSIFRFIAPRDKDTFREQWDKAVTQKKCKFETYIKGQQQEKIYAELSISLLSDEARLYLVGITNINDRKKEEEKLKCSRECAKSIIDNSLGIIITMDKKYCITSLNKTAAEAFGYSKKDVLGKHIRELYATDDECNKVEEKVSTEGHYVGETLNRRKNGDVFPCLTTVSVFSDTCGNVCGIVGSSFDISYRKMTEQQMLESTELAHRVIDSSLGMIIAVDKKRSITVFNKAAQEIFGYSEEEVLGKTVRMLYATDEENDRIGQILSQKDRYIGETVNRRKNGDVFPCFMSASVMKNKQGEVIGVVGNSKDITREKEIEQQLQAYQSNLEKAVRLRTAELEDAKRQAEHANYIKSEFLSNMSHELRTPMQGVLGFSRLGIDRCEKLERSKLKSYFEDIYYSGERLMGLLDNLLDLSNLEAEKIDYIFKKQSVSDLIQAAIKEVNMLADKRGINISFQTVQFSDLAYFDFFKKLQVLKNILLNAIRFSSSKSDIIIRMEDRGAMLMISVIDEGIGIPDGELETIFQKFMQSSHTNDGSGGTGLGLAISKKIVLDHKGKIWAEHNPSGGAIIKVCIPKQKIYTHQC